MTAVPVDYSIQSIFYAGSPADCRFYLTPADYYPGIPDTFSGWLAILLQPAAATEAFPVGNFPFLQPHWHFLLWKNSMLPVVP